MYETLLAFSSTEISRHKKVWDGSFDSEDEIVLPPEDL
jgi:hypothetical protein